MHRLVLVGTSWQRDGGSRLRIRGQHDLADELFRFGEVLVAFAVFDFSLEEGGVAFSRATSMRDVGPGDPVSRELHLVGRRGLAGNFLPSRICPEIAFCRDRIEGQLRQGDPLHTGKGFGQFQCDASLPRPVCGTSCVQTRGSQFDAAGILCDQAENHSHQPGHSVLPTSCVHADARYRKRQRAVNSAEISTGG